MRLPIILAHGASGILLFYVCIPAFLGGAFLVSSGTFRLIRKRGAAKRNEAYIAGGAALLLFAAIATKWIQ